MIIVPALGIVLAFGIILAAGAATGATAQDAGALHRSIKVVTDVMVHDIFSPPVASRIYAYVSVAGYEAARAGDGRYRSLAGHLLGLPEVIAPAARKRYNFSDSARPAAFATRYKPVLTEGRPGQIAALP